MRIDGNLLPCKKRSIKNETKCTQCLKRESKKNCHRDGNAEVVVELPDETEITSIITKTSAESMKLKEGSEVYAAFKAQV